MSNNEQSRIDRLEALAEQILEGLAQTRQRTDSNAKSIEALANAVAAERKERQRSERRLYESMAKMSEAIAQIGSAQASFWEIQADYYRRLEEMDSRQATMLEILNRLTPRENNS